MSEQPKSLGIDLGSASLDVIGLFLDETDDPTVFQNVYKDNLSRPEVLKLLYEHPDTPDEIRETTAGTLRLPVLSRTEIEAIKSRELARKEAKPKEIRKETLTQRVQKLNISDRVRLAMKGNREVRSILLKDTNKEVILAVLENGKITDSEVESIARSRQVIEDALRKIARNREWMRSYPVLYALVTNPKTPAGIAMQYVSALKTRDLHLLEKNKNVAAAVRSAAKKLFSARKRGV